MGKVTLFLALAALAVGIVAAPLTASGGPPTPDAFDTFEHTKNLKPRGYSPRAVGITNSDLAFWGDLAFQGSYDGFRIIDISDPTSPDELLFQPCDGNQGDVIVWDDILLRSYNSPAAAGAMCDGEPIAEGFEGIHVFDISNLMDPDLVATVDTDGGSHTATAAPDLANNRLIVYNQTSGSSTPYISILEVPLSNPENTSVIGTEPLMEADACHDSGVILGKVNKLVCASHSHANVYDIGDNSTPGGSLTDPEFLFHITEPGVGTATPGIGSGNWHSASWTWDGEVIILGWEPGGGSQPRCAANGTFVGTSGGVPVIQQDVHKSYFFYDADDGTKLGQFVLPRPQTVDENCTIHNYNVVPLKNRKNQPRYVLVAGNYQSGISVVDFSDPANAKEIAYADPAPLPDPDPAPGGPLGGDWSTYFYNGYLYESDITRGLLTWRLRDRAVYGYRTLPHLNPQTQEFSLHRN
jgi:LVIVD repeat